MLTVKSILTGALVLGAATLPAGVVVTDLATDSVPEAPGAIAAETGCGSKSRSFPSSCCRPRPRRSPGSRIRERTHLSLHSKTRCSSGFRSLHRAG